MTFRLKQRATKKALKRKAMKGIFDDFQLGNWLNWLKFKRGEIVLKGEDSSGNDPKER